MYCHCCINQVDEKCLLLTFHSTLFLEGWWDHPAPAKHFYSNIQFFFLLLIVASNSPVAQRQPGIMIIVVLDYSNSCKELQPL